MRPLWPSAQGKFVSKRAATRTFQKLASLAGVDSRITGHMCRVTGAQAMAVAGVDLWLTQAFCRWGSGAVLEYVRDCQLSAAVEVSAQVAKGVQIMEVRESMYQQVEDTMGCEHVVSCEHKFDQALEEQMAALGLTEVKKNNISRKSRLA